MVDVSRRGGWTTQRVGARARRTWIALAALFWASGFGGMGEDAPVLNWRWSHPIPHGNNVADMVFREGRYIQVTDHGGIYLSTNRLIWERQESGTDRDLRGAAFLGDRLLVTGQEGLALWSDDGRNFQRAVLSPPTDDWLEGVAASDSVAVAVGDNGAAYRTVDGASWQRVPMAGSGQWLSGVAYGAGVFVAVGERGFIATSSDGSHWELRDSGRTSDLTRVAFGSGVFVAVGTGGLVLTSANGTTWVEDGIRATDQDLLAAASGPLGRLAVGEGALLMRTPPDLWESQLSIASSPLPAPDWTYLASIWDGERYVISGRTGVTVESLHTNLANEKVTLWLRQEESPRNWLWAAERVGGAHIAVGDRGLILTSHSGVEWSPEISPTGLETVLYGVGGTPGVALAVGSGGVILRSESERVQVVTTNVITVGDAEHSLVVTQEVDLIGLRWEEVASRPTTNTLQGIAWDGTRHVVVGANGVVLRSADPGGREWELGSIGSGAFFSTVTPSPHGWVAGGTDGALFVSPDASTWQAVSSGASEWIYRVRAFGSQLVGVGEEGLILTSTNGVNWTRRSSGTDAWLTDVRKIGDTYYVCGSQGTLLRSADLAQWSRVAIPTGKALNALAVWGEQIIAVGAEGIVLRALTSAAVSNTTIADYRHRRREAAPVDLFRFQGTPERRFRLETGESLGQWTTAEELQLGTDGTAFHGRAVDGARRFYRARDLQ